MKIVLAFDSFKGCMTAEEACHAAEKGLRKRYPDADIVSVPLSDGGEGLVTCVENVLQGTKRVQCNAHSPLLEPITANYILSEDGRTAFMEMAETCGLALVPKHLRNPMKTTTYGVGDMIIDATKRGCKEIIMGIGGSATCDGGQGMIKCLQDKGININSLPKIIVACDVNNPLYGKNGAAHIFAPQKGATPEQVIELDRLLRKFAEETERQGIADSTMAKIPGAGAAGGLGYGMMAYLKAELKSGIDIILNIADFDSIIKDSDIIITGEGKSDKQTLMGKVPYGVLSRAYAHNIPVFLLSGSIEDKSILLDAGFHRVHSINENDNRPLETLMKKDVATNNMAISTQALII